MATLETEAEVEAARVEFADRFGILPTPVADLFFLLRIKALARARFVRAIETQDGVVTGPELVLKLSPFVVCDRVALYKAFGTRAVVKGGQVRIPRAASAEKWRRDLLVALDSLRVIEAAPASAGISSVPQPNRP